MKRCPSNKQIKESSIFSFSSFLCQFLLVCCFGDSSPIRVSFAFSCGSLRSTAPRMGPFNPQPFQWAKAWFAVVGLVDVDRESFKSFPGGLGGGNSNIFYFHPEPWGNDPILTNIFGMGWNHQPAGDDPIWQKNLQLDWRHPLAVMFAKELSAIFLTRCGGFKDF